MSRKPRRITLPDRPGLSRRLDHVAIGATRQHAILQLAGSRQIARKPDADSEQHDGDHQTRDGTVAIFRLVVLFRMALGAVVGIGHLAHQVRWKRRRASTTTAPEALRLLQADGLNRRTVARRRDMTDPIAGRQDADRAMALPAGPKLGARHRRRIGKADGNRDRGTGQYRRDHQKGLPIPPRASRRSSHCGQLPVGLRGTYGRMGISVVIEITCDQIPHIPLRTCARPANTSLSLISGVLGAHNGWLLAA